MWNQYCFLAERLQRINRQLEILLLITGVFFAIYSYQAPTNYIVFLPSLIIFSLIYIIALYFILPRLIRVPWVRNDTDFLEFEKYRKKGDVSGFYKQLVTESYKFE